jgi:hypothetical protein
VFFSELCEQRHIKVNAIHYVYRAKRYEHRRQWIVDRIKQLTDIFAINSCAFTVISNHFHVIFHVDVERAAKWSEQAVIERWGR